MSYPFIMQGKNIVIFVNGSPHTVTEGHLNYSELKDAIKFGDWESIPRLISPVEMVESYGKGKFKIIDNEVVWGGRVLTGNMEKRILDMFNEGLPIDSMVMFFENLQKNPSNIAINELYGFMEKNSLPITPDGHFLAYKKVRSDYTDCHSGTLDNSKGKVVAMPRENVDSDRDRTCSSGLHFCSFDYLKSFQGQRLMVLKIDPANVVSIPSDYGNSKGRCCEYEVVDEIFISNHYDEENDVLSEEIVVDKYSEERVPLSLRKRMSLFNEMCDHYGHDSNKRTSEKFSTQKAADNAFAELFSLEEINSFIDMT